MNLEIKYDAVIEVHPRDREIQIYFAKQPDNKILQELDGAKNIEGFDFFQMDGYWKLKFNPVYSDSDVAQEVESILRRHGHEYLLFKFYKAAKCSEKQHLH